jgi:hypothetical protein
VLFVVPSFRCMIYVSSGFDLEPVLSLRHNSLIRTRMRIGRVSIAQHLRCGRFFRTCYSGLRLTRFWLPRRSEL